MTAEALTPTVLVAEDDADICDLVEMVLEDEDYVVVKAPNGAKALEIATESPPDICILDVMMPKLDGVELTRRLREGDGTREVPIILLSARTQWEAVQRGRQAGADEYLTKPFIAEDLLASVRGLLIEANAKPEEPDERVMELLAQAEDPRTGSPCGLVLVAAPDENLVALVAYRLGLGGYEVATAHDLTEASQVAGERRPDLCLLDTSMPAIDGLPVMHIHPTTNVQELFGEVEQMLKVGSSPGAS